MGSSLRFIPATLFSFLLGGCALTDASVDLAYLPETGKVSPLAKIAPLEISLQLEDQRPAEERQWVGNKRNGYGMVTAHIKSNKDVLSTILEGLRNEFVSHGHRVVNAAAPDSSILVRLGLKRYWSDVSIHFWDVEVSGNLTADVNVFRLPSETPLLSKVLQGAFRESRQLATDTAYESVLNGALREFIRGFARDPSVLRTLELRRDEGQREAQATDDGQNAQMRLSNRPPS